MTEKDTVSMATVQMKPDYAASEVYSTASEAPPAYKRQANSVKIAKITAFTVIVASFILGSFILASAYLDAKASCDHVQALDSVLEKELMLETLQQVKDLPRAEALIGHESFDDSDLQKLDRDEDVVKKMPAKPQTAAAMPEMVVAEEENKDNSYSESEEAEELQKHSSKLPVELDLSDLAAALLQSNTKSRMNCVIERKHAEEIVDTPSKTVALPFGMNLTTDPKKAKITGERLSIYCESGNENKPEQEAREMTKNTREEEEDNEDEIEPVRPMFIPYHRVPIPFGPIPHQFPLTHMPQRMMPPMQQQQPQPQPQPQQHMIRQMPPPFQQLPLRLPMPPQIMQAPRPESHMFEPQQQTLRIHVQQLPFKDFRVADEMPIRIPAPHQELPRFQIQRVPLAQALQRAGITPEDLQNIQRMAEDRISDELRRLAAEEASDSSEVSNNGSEEEDDSQNHSDHISNEEEPTILRQQPEPQQQQQQQQQPQPEAREESPAPPRLILQPLPEQPRDTMTPPMPDQASPLVQFGRATYGRSLLQPVRIPVPMMQQAELSQDSTPSATESEGLRILNPRSV